MFRLLLLLQRLWNKASPEGTPKDAQELAQAGILYAPASFLTASEIELELICNGCGPSGWKVDIVPDHIFYLYIGSACNIHDWMYHHGRSDEDKKEADRVFLNNLIRLIERDKSKLRDKKKMIEKAKGYYFAVKYAGGPAFWRNKNANT